MDNQVGGITCVRRIFKNQEVSNSISTTLPQLSIIVTEKEKKMKTIET